MLAASDVRALSIAGSSRSGLALQADDIDDLIAAVSSRANRSTKAGILLRKRPVRPAKVSKAASNPDAILIDPVWETAGQERASRIDRRDLRVLAPALTSSLEPFLTGLPERLASNLIIADIAHTGGTGAMVKYFFELGMLVDKATFITKAKEYSNLAKLRLLELDDGCSPEWFVEAQNLAGVKYPDESSDEVTSDDLRASAGVASTPDEPMRSVFEKFFNAQRLTAKTAIRSLDEYILSMDWRTGGSASMTGERPLEVTMSDEEFKVRLTKALVPYVMTPEKLTNAVKMVSGLASVIVKTVIKMGETGDKVRLIYPYPLAVAIAKMYVLECIAGDGNYPTTGKSNSILNWSTSLGGANMQESLRHLRTLALVSKDAAASVCDANPWFMRMLRDAGAAFDLSELEMEGFLAVIASDAAAFDKQVGRFFSELFWAKVKAAVGSAASSALPEPMPREFILPLDRSDDYLTTKGRREKEESGDFDSLVAACIDLLIENEALLLSGVPETSKLGTGVSWTVCDITASAINVTAPGSVVMYESRGDDMIAVLRAASKYGSENVAALWWLCSSAFLDFSAQKSRIVTAPPYNTEFLRVDYSDEGVKGYVNRALVWVAEARPLGEEDVTTWASKAVAGVERALTCLRRGAHIRLLNLCVANAVRALAKLGIDRRYLSATKENGGAGLLAPNRSVFYTGNTRKAAISTEYKLQWMSDRVISEMPPDTATTRAEALSVAEQRVSGLIASAAPAKIRQKLVGKPRFLRTLMLDGPPLVAISAAINTPPDRDFGSVPDLEARFSKLAELAAVRGVSTWSLLPEVEKNVLRRVEKRYKLPRHAAVSWVSGAVGTNESSMHPELSRMRASIVSRVFNRVRKEKKYDADNSATALASLTYAIGLTIQDNLQLLYSW